MNDDEVPDFETPADSPPPNGRAAPTGLPASLPWFAAAGFALLAGFTLPAYFFRRSEAVVLREQVALAEIQGRILRQQIEAEHILSARRVADLINGHQGGRDLGRLQVLPLVHPAGPASAPFAVVMWDPGSQEGELVVCSLPAPAPDRSYQLWLFDSEHPAGTSIAVFAVDPASSRARIPLKLDLSGAAGASFRVSLERKGGASAPEGPVALASR
jgi:hypothetical protein